MKILKFALPANGNVSEELISVHTDGPSDLQAGSAFLPKGTRVPATGANAYPKHEISFIISGCIEGEVNGEPCRFTSGDIIQMLPFETQWGVAVEDTMIFYTFFGKTQNA